MAENSPLFWPFIGVFSIGLIMNYWCLVRHEKNVIKWAKHHDYTLLECEGRAWFVGPFFFRKSRAQQVYRIAIRAGKRSIRRGWALSGGGFFGFLTDQVEVIWDDER